jgi:hypothetical protein
VADAAAKVTRKGFLDLFFSGRRMLTEKPLCTHDNAGRAKATLKRCFIDKCLLKRIELSSAWIAQAFDCGYGFSATLNRERHAGEHCLSIHEHGATSARAAIARYLGPRETEGFPEREGEGMGRIYLIRPTSHFQFIDEAIDREADATPFEIFLFNRLCRFPWHVTPSFSMNQISSSNIQIPNKYHAARGTRE